MPAHALEPVPVADFFRNPEVSAAVLSPSGQHVAALMLKGAGKRQRLVVIDLKNLSASKVVAEYGDVDIARVWWVNDERLVYGIADTQSPLGEQPGLGLWSVDREGKEAPRRLIRPRQYFVTEPDRVGERALSVYHRFYATLRDGSNDVVVTKAMFDSRRELTGVALLRLDTVTGRTSTITQDAPPDTTGWALDPQGVPRVAVAHAGGKSRLYWKATAGAPAWTLVDEYDTFGGSHAPAPLAIGANNLLYAEARYGANADTASLLSYDLRASKPLKAQPLMALKGFDFSGTLVFNPRGDLLGVHYLTDAAATFWYDAGLKAVQAKVDALLPATVNTIDCGNCTDPAVVLVTAFSDRQPATYQLFDTRSGKLEPLARSRPWIDPARMAVRDMQYFTARDGMSIPVYVTRPPGVKGPAPTVVLVHGGPWVRGGDWQWYPDSQFLASRGFVVVEPAFRGSTGFGHKLFRAGWKQWGLAMQDDVADATRWAAQQGFTDPKRVCLAGASYGGYATLMGLIRDAALYRCGVEWAGVSDIDLMYDVNWSDFSQMWKTYGMPAMVGDQQKDAAQLAATSPLKLASGLKQPLLMAHGSEDYRVPLVHASRMHDALKATNPDVEYVVYPGEGHGWMLESTEVDFWTRVDKFLSRNLAPAP